MNKKTKEDIVDLTENSIDLEKKLIKVKDLLREVSHIVGNLSGVCNNNVFTEQEIKIISVLDNVKDTLLKTWENVTSALIINDELIEDYNRGVIFEGPIRINIDEDDEDKGSIVVGDDLRECFDEPVKPLLREMKVGQIAQEVLRKALEDGKASDEEIEKLQQSFYSKEIFDIQYPLLKKLNDLNEKRPARYYKKPVNIRGTYYWLCSEWYETKANNDRYKLIRWLSTH